MNKLVCMLFGLILAAVSFSLAQFEGVIDMKVTDLNNDKPQETRYTLFVKNSMLSTELKSDGVESNHGKFIFRGDKGMFWIVNNEERNYLEISMKDSDKSRKQSSASKNAEKKATHKMKKTGRKETILGYSCEELVAEEGGRTTHIWGTAKLGNVYEGLAKSLGQMGWNEKDDGDDWQDELANLKIFPLKITALRDGKTEETQEVTRIEAKPLSASMFMPPDGYTKQSFDLNVEKIMKQMQEDMVKSKLGESKKRETDLDTIMNQMMKHAPADSTDDDDDDDDD